MATPQPPGDIDLVYMRDQYGWFGVSFYFTFIFVMTFIVLNMFFTIVGDAFSVTKEEVANEKNQYELLNFITGLVKDMLGMRTAAEREAELNEEENEEETTVEELSVPTLSVDDADALEDEGAEDDDSKDSKEREGGVPGIAIYTVPTTPPPTRASARPHAHHPPSSMLAIPGMGDGLPENPRALQQGRHQSSPSSSSSSSVGGSAPPSPGKSVLRSTPSESDSGVAVSGELPGAVEGPPVTDDSQKASEKVLSFEVPPPACYIPPGEQNGNLAMPGKDAVISFTSVPDASTLYLSSPTTGPLAVGSTPGGKCENLGGLKDAPRPLSASFLAGIEVPETPVPSQVAAILGKLETMESLLQRAVGTSPLDG
ncbi:uncharacterized protein LOC135219016 [Macrobrachium nipponense]|uniref:uncharacterized protein LOC135219016 n=1 Tax=Macrobrachium nipponense TaxID=159736 RepID=UPI0030C80161